MKKDCTFQMANLPCIMGGKCVPCTVVGNRVELRDKIPPIRTTLKVLVNLAESLGIETTNLI